MPTYLASYQVITDTYQLTYRPEDPIIPGSSSGEFSDGVLVPQGPWTTFISPYALEPYGGIGIQLKLESGELLELLAHLQPPPGEIGVNFVKFTGRRITLRVEQDAGILRYSWSENMLDWTEVASFSPGSPVTEVGVVLRYDRPDLPASGWAGQARLLQGIWENITEEVWIAESDAPVATPQRGAVTPFATQVGVTSTSEPLVHVIVGAQFGDLEFDIGKSVRWVTWFCDNVFVLDINLGTQRYWVVNWTQTFPDAEHAVTGINYFVRPTEFRREQWEQYRLAFGEPDNSDWILFVDGHEGLGVDNRSLPDDYDFAPFKSFLWREIQRAEDLGESSAVLPYYVFLRSDHITNVTYATRANDPSGTTPDVLQALSVPYYLPYQGLRRLWNVAALRDPDFDWSQIDTPVAPAANAKAQIISYGYAHWNMQDIDPPATEVPALDANNDDGYRMRKLLNRVRPVSGLPVGDTWIPPDQDPAGLPGPWAPADANNPDPIDPITGQLLPQPVPADASLEGLVTPLYDCVFRINMRDGVWYEAGLSGNIPLKWDGTKWITEYDPELWPKEGVEAHDPYYVAP